MFNVTHLIETGGLFLIGAMVFAESGIMVGLFLPGDTLLLSAGILAATGELNIVSLCVVVSLAAIAGDNTGYQIGKSLGHRLFTKKDGVIFRKEYINRAEKFYEKYGGRAMLVEHFIPIIRSFAPVTAGAGHMNRALFFVCNAIGDIAWAVSFTLFGYYVGSKIPHIERYIDPAIIAIVLLFTVPALIRVLADPRIRAAIRNRLRRGKSNNTK
ncbi:MAG TPA: VTT domain-containing protein [Candidatus Saccharimonadales bacterium]|nr:VTT domain-containing protein [Candidatus Saccharimonadales bacterium]